MATQEATEERIALGRAISSWMKSNGISQQIPHDWAKATGQNGPWNSQISLLQRGMLDPKGSFWLSMAAFNKAIDDGVAQGCTARVRETIIDAEPFLNHKEEPATAVDLFAMFTGLSPVLERYLQAPVITEQDAATFSKRCKKVFDLYMENEMLTRKEAWVNLMQRLTVDPQVQSRLQKVLIGEGALSVDHLEAGMEPIKQAYSALGLDL